jgi:hypothetical protein
MAKQETIPTYRFHSPIALLIQEELDRVRQRSNARLGTGISRRSVQQMVAKYERDQDR